ncbi:MAG: 3-dehydroquinate synthase [Bryobacteraceae bacterium]|nr:3-dehydroquinate synthase [Bryobacteraceae bacterium]
MPSFAVETRQRTYPAVVERGAIAGLQRHIPASAGVVFVVTTEDVWQAHGDKVARSFEHRPHRVLFFPGGEDRKRLVEVERLAEQMVEARADRSSIVVAFGGGIVNDLAGFLAASFMRGIPVIQIPTTLLAQVDAGVGGKTGVNLVSGKNLFGAFHQPLAVLIDPDVLATLPSREFRAGLYEVLKTGVIRSERLFNLMAERYAGILRLDPDLLLDIIAESVSIKAAVVSADERESDLRRILNFGHTIGHALEAETAYTRLLHGEAVAFGMRAATRLAALTGCLDAAAAARIVETIARYGPIPPLDGVSAPNLVRRLASDKKTVKGAVHFVLPVKIGDVKIVSGIDEGLVLDATRAALEELAAG